MRRPAVPGALALLLAAASSIAAADPTGLTLAQRVDCERALQRVYHSHIQGADRSFEEAVPEEVLERRVLASLRRSAALDQIWKSPLSDLALRRELRRMERQTRMPGRLRELKAALGDDPVLILECLARPALADRMARSFFARDETLHGGSRAQAAAIRDRIVAGLLDPRDSHPLKRMSPGGSGRPAPASRPEERSGPSADGADMAPRPRETDGLEESRLAPPSRGGEGALPRAATVEETPEAFLVRAPLSSLDGPGSGEAIYTIPKRTWESWWEEAEAGLDPGSVSTVASDAPLAAGAGQTACSEPGAWDNGALEGDLVDGRILHTALWTGSLMLIWGNEPDDGTPTRGARYDPAIDTWTPISDDGAPSRRLGHTAVWTGAGMIIWGGLEPGTTGLPFDDGARYNPVSDTWTPLSGTGAPAARFFHQAVWTGDRMIVWGGRLAPLNAAAVTSSGAIYHPAADAWAPLPETGAPSGRWGHAALWTGSRVLVYGGVDGTVSPVNDGAAFDPASGIWTPLAAAGAPSPRSGFTAVWDGTRMIIWGGEEPGFVSLDTGGLYDPATDSWSPTSTTGAPDARAFHTAVWTGDRMIVWGGRGRSFPDRAGHLYDPATDSWSSTTTANAPHYRDRHTAVWTGSLMIVWGGEDSYDAAQPRLASGGRYDPATDTWTPTLETGTPAGRKDHAAVWTGSHMILWGGRRVIDSPLADGALYDPALETWTPMPPVPFINPFYEGRRNPTAIWTGDRMIVWGGLGVIENQATYSDGFSFDPVSGSIEPIATAGQPTPRGNHTAVWTGRQMIVYGGEHFVGTHSPTPVSTPGGAYDPAADSWRLLPTAGEPGSRLGHSAVWSGTRMLVWGGEGHPAAGAGYSPRFNTWVPISTTGAPALERHSAVWTGTEMIVWGYALSAAPPYIVPAGGRFDQTTNTWLPVSTAQAPSRAAETPAVWTGTEMLLWWSAGSPINGRYDPATDSWLPIPSLGAPAAAGGGDHTAVWSGDAMIVWGGNARQPGTALYSNRGGLFYPDGVTVLDGDGDGVTICDGDCDDAHPDVYPGAPQICDGVNNNCLHPDWPSLAGLGEVDMDGDGFRLCDADCNDAEPGIYPGAFQACDGINNDCLDPGWPSLAGLGEEDLDGDGFFACEGDCDDAEPASYPGNTEICDLLDNNCDGATDEGLVRAVSRVHPPDLGLASRGRFFSIQVEVFDSCNPDEGRRLHGREVERTWVSRVGRHVLPDPLSRPCPDHGQYGFERGLVETISARTVTPFGVILRFQEPWDRDCRTLEGDMDSLEQLIYSERFDIPVPLCVAGTARGATFESCSEVFRRGRYGIRSMLPHPAAPFRRGERPSIPPEDPSP